MTTPPLDQADPEFRRQALRRGRSMLWAWGIVASTDDYLAYWVGTDVLDAYRPDMSEEDIWSTTRELVMSLPQSDAEGMGEGLPLRFGGAAPNYGYERLVNITRALLSTDPDLLPPIGG